MVQGQQQPIISCVIFVCLSTGLALSHFANDLYSPLMFIFKAGLQPLTFIVLALMICYSLKTKQKWLIGASLYAVVVNAIFIMPNWVASQNTSVSKKEDILRVATFSALTRTNNIPDIINFAASESPDLLCLQEVSLTDRAPLLQQLNKLYPYQIQNDNNQITLSRFPLNTIEDAGYYQSSQLEHPKLGNLNIVNTHMPRPYLSKGLADDWVRFLNYIDGDSTIIICGDLNITPSNSLYDLLTNRYKLSDSFINGYGFTYPNAQRRSALLGPLIRIDYVLTRNFFSLETRTINASKLSDHRAVVTELVLQR